MAHTQLIGFLSAIAICTLGMGDNSQAIAAYPDKPIRFIVPFPAGGNVDLVARVIAQQLSEKLERQVLIDNRVGAAGMIGTEMAANAPNDGYTILMGSIGALSINPSIYKQLPYDPIKSFSPLTLTSVTPNLLVVTNSLPINSVKGLIALAKARPAQLNFGSGGIGTGNHLSMELFRIMAGINVVHVPYKGAPLAMTDLIAGQIQIMTPPMPATLPFVKSAKLKALAVTSATRSEAAPELPTVAESGFPGFDVTSWYGVLTPVGTPRGVIEKLRGDIVAVLNLPEVRSYLAHQGAEVRTTTPDGFRAFIESEIAKWAKVVKVAGVNAQ